MTVIVDCGKIAVGGAVEATGSVFMEKGMGGETAHAGSTDNTEMQRERKCYLY